MKLYLPLDQAPQQRSERADFSKNPHLLPALPVSPGSHLQGLEQVRVSQRVSSRSPETVEEKNNVPSTLSGERLSETPFL